MCPAVGASCGLLNGINDSDVGTDSAGADDAGADDAGLCAQTRVADGSQPTRARGGRLREFVMDNYFNSILESHAMEREYLLSQTAAASRTPSFRGSESWQPEPAVPEHSASYHHLSVSPSAEPARLPLGTPYIRDPAQPVAVPGVVYNLDTLGTSAFVDDDTYHRGEVIVGEWATKADVAVTNGQASNLLMTAPVYSELREATPDSQLSPDNRRPSLEYPGSEADDGFMSVVHYTRLAWHKSVPRGYSVQPEHIRDDNDTDERTVSPVLATVKDEPESDWPAPRRVSHPPSVIKTSPKSGEPRTRSINRLRLKAPLPAVSNVRKGKHGPVQAAPPKVRTDSAGVKWITFIYSVKSNHVTNEIRCDIEHVDVSRLSWKFKSDNCMYPRACVPEAQYTGNRYKYETECNGIGWALASLNPAIQQQRGLIQRAVDSWRNSNSDESYRSRRVRRKY